MQIGQCPVEFTVGGERQVVERSERDHHPPVHPPEDGGEGDAQPFLQPAYKELFDSGLYMTILEEEYKREFARL